MRWIVEYAAPARAVGEIQTDGQSLLRKIPALLCCSSANLLHCRSPFYPRFKQVDSLGAYSIASRDRLFSSHLFARVIVRYAYPDP
jgi:hypothetical protein